MPPRGLIRAFLLLWITVGVALLIGSVETAYHGWFSTRGVHPHLVLIGGIEAIAAGVMIPGAHACCS